MINGLHEAKRLLRYSTIRSGLSVISALRLGKLFPGAAKNGLIFTLHHVRPADNSKSFSPNGILSVTPEFLEATIQTVLKAGMIPVHVHELPELLRNKPGKNRYVCFTLDDGYRDNAKFAAPIFLKYKIPFTIYITSGFSAHTKILWWETVECLLKKLDRLSFDFGHGNETLILQSRRQKMAGFERFAHYVDGSDEEVAVDRIASLAQANNIDSLKLTKDLIMDVNELAALADNKFAHLGAHTASHFNLKRTNPMRRKEEIITSAEWLKHQLNVVPQSFAHPYGWTTAVSPCSCAAVYEAGFSIAVTTQPGMLSPDCLAQPQAFPRVSLNGYFQKQRYIEALITGIPFMKYF
ncbi:polysaccharide deacetylase [Pseudochrobactrum sp. MP213Fo]|uniref:polysaccharide deacetylase n=1 Tax=Pseudochrobactrum sp. MP213Fo TaxID=3022250 RepID=UPI003B9E078A